MNPTRLTIVETHPVQYNAPWFKYVAQNCPAIDLTVLYASRPTPEQQAVGFDRAFEWDAQLFEGYRWRVVRESRPADTFDSDTFRGLDVREIGDAVLETKPDVVLVPGWHSVTQIRALAACRRHGVPVLYRGDTHAGMRPGGVRGLLWGVKTRGLLRQYAAHLSVGWRSRQYLLAHGVPPSRIHASPHAVDNDFFARMAAPHLTDAGRAEVRRAFGFERDDFVVLFVGKLNERKCVGDAIRAATALGPKAALLVVGHGSREAALRAEAARLGVRVTWAGFLNQSALGPAYAAADCLVLPSRLDSWGLVVNEAMATGLPVVVSEDIGCAPDLVVTSETGERFRAGDVADLAAALGRVREHGARTQMAAACRDRIANYTFAHAAAGLEGACQSVRRSRGVPRVIACCGGMVMVFGLERMTFEVLRVIRERGGAVHCIVNNWENHRIVPLAARIGASWSTGYYAFGFTRRTLNPIRHAQSLWDIARTSAGLVRDALRFRPTHVLVPDYTAILRNAPALALLRLCGVRIIFRNGNAPERGEVYDLLWRRVLPPFVTTFVPISRFCYGRLEEVGVPARKITMIRNALSRRVVRDQTDEGIVRLAASRRTLLTVGQIAPFKGTHLAVEAALGLIAEGHDIQAVIVGPLPIWPADLVTYVQQLQERIAGAGARDRIHFVGGCENVPAIMRASFVLAAPILQEETFGMVVLEARSVGLPVVTFARGDLGELVTHRQTGYICPTADLAGLREGLRYFLTHPDERDRASANSLAAASGPDDDCTPTEFERRWWALFERAS
jgi:glycosyltransferase involved in cell wall biosynthesis